jgi:hypothetical protein
MSLGPKYETEDFFSTIAAVITFLGCFIYSIATYGLLLGGGLGWIPSLIVAVIAYYFVLFFGKGILMIVIVALFYYFFNR